MRKLSEVLIYTDGACRGNPGPGGWGALLIYGEVEKELCGGDPLTTNNRMELQGPIEALGSLKRPCRVTIRTDSKSVLQGLPDWLQRWQERDWKTMVGEPVKNIELWKALEAAAAPHTVNWEWVKGHAGEPGNERADALANKGIDTLPAPVAETPGDDDEEGAVSFLKAMDQMSQDNAAEDRKQGLLALRAANIPLEVKNNGAHLIVHAKTGVIDFWPGTGLWIPRNGRQRQRGLDRLLKHLGIQPVTQ